MRCGAVLRCGAVQCGAVQCGAVCASCMVGAGCKAAEPLRAVAGVGPSLCPPSRRAADVPVFGPSLCPTIFKVWRWRAVHCPPPPTTTLRTKFRKVRKRKKTNLARFEKILYQLVHPDVRIGCQIVPIYRSGEGGIYRSGEGGIYRNGEGVTHREWPGVGS